MSDMTIAGTTGPIQDLDLTFRAGDLVILLAGEARFMGRAVRDPNAEGALIQGFPGDAPLNHTYSEVRAVVTERMACNFLVAFAAALCQAGVPFYAICNNLTMDPLGDGQFQHFTRDEPSDGIFDGLAKRYIADGWMTTAQADLLYCLAFGHWRSPYSD